MKRIVYCFGLILILSMFCGPLNTGSICVAADGNWAAKADMPTGRMALSTSAVNESIYAIGGRRGTTPIEVLATVEAYNPSTNTWAKKASMPTPRYWLSTATVGGILYAIGGTSSPFAGYFKPLSTVEAYDPVTDTWTSKADMPTPRYGLSLDVVDGIIYAIGGTRSDFDGFTTVEAYDPVTDTWTSKTDMPTGRGFLSTCVSAGKIYALGGWPDRSFTSLSKVEVYDPATDVWAQVADLPTPRAVFSTSLVNGVIYAIGGSVKGINSAFSGCSTVEAFNPGTNIWTKATDMPTERARLSTTTLDGKIYAIGGGKYWPADALATVEVYTP